MKDTTINIAALKARSAGSAVRRTLGTAAGETGDVLWLGIKSVYSFCAGLVLGEAEHDAPSASRDATRGKVPRGRRAAA
ncbi:MAG: hypothetical protein LBV29_03010 [Azoarcus sp.]|jgi:hypothetical protein|nr:hypothetical protein [Azoarcus sp.]